MDSTLFHEFKRKLIHMVSVIYPLMYFYFFDKFTMIVIITSLFFAVLLWDVLRIRGIKIKLLTFFYTVVREKEGKRLVGATYFLASNFIVILFFPKDVAILSMLILVLCDTAAALIGKAYGKHKITSLAKSWEGFLAFNFFGILIIFTYFSLLPNLTYTVYIVAFIALLVTSIIELLANKIHIDDNLLINITFSSIMILGY